MVSSLAYLNGQFIDADKLCLPVHDAGFVMGATVTDLCRSFGHKLYRWTDHAARFERSCSLARISLAVAGAELNACGRRLVENNIKLLDADSDLALVIFATPGPIGYYAGLPGGPGEGTATIGMHTFPVPLTRYRSYFTNGARLITPATRHIPGACVPPAIKMRSRLSWWLADQEAREQDPTAQALLLDLDGHVTETAAANFLIVHKGTVLSPPAGTVLPGISLDTIRELCRELAIPYEERPITLGQCLGADEAMLAGTAFCLAGVSQLNGKPIPWPGPVTVRLQELWRQKLNFDFRRQILSSR